MNIQRGRDHGLPGYFRWREFCDLPKANTFDNLKDEIKDRTTRELLKKLYKNFEEYTDVFVGGLAEDNLNGSLVGPLFHCLIKEQFIRLRDGDKYYYENEGVFDVEQLDEIKKVTLASIMCTSMKGKFPPVQRQSPKDVLSKRYFLKFRKISQNSQKGLKACRTLLVAPSAFIRVLLKFSKKRYHTATSLKNSEFILEYFMLKLSGSNYIRGVAWTHTNI